MVPAAGWHWALPNLHLQIKARVGGRRKKCRRAQRSGARASPPRPPSFFSKSWLAYLVPPSSVCLLIASVSPALQRERSRPPASLMSPFSCSRCCVHTHALQPTLQKPQREGERERERAGRGSGSGGGGERSRAQTKPSSGAADGPPSPLGRRSNRLGSGAAPPHLPPRRPPAPLAAGREVRGGAGRGARLPRQ